jgi:hypothetical protein
MQSLPRSKRLYYRSVFRRVINHYEEIKATNGTNSCDVFYKSLASGATGAKYNSRVIQMSASDLIADVELKAKRVLSIQEYSLWKCVYLNQDKKFETEAKQALGSVRFLEIKHTMQEKLGEAFVRCKIYPIGRYMKPIDLR